MLRTPSLRSLTITVAAAAFAVPALASPESKAMYQGLLADYPLTQVGQVMFETDYTRITKPGAILAVLLPGIYADVANTKDAIVNTNYADGQLTQATGFAAAFGGTTAHLLQSRYQRLKVERDPIFIKEDKFYTTAGVTAGIDLSLALVEEDLGHAVAAEIARILVLFLRRPGGQSQYSTLLAQQEEIEDARMRDLPVWVKGHLNRKLGVEDLAKAAAMSPRTFMRQFKAQFETTPARWVQSLRVEAAMQHLGEHSSSLSKIAQMTGFRDEQALRRALLQEIGLTPKQYRARFGEVDSDRKSHHGQRMESESNSVRGAEVCA